MNTNLSVNVKVNEYYQEVDKRFTRIVQVLKVKNRMVQIKTVKQESSKYGGNSVGRITWAAKYRFDGRCHGYALLTGYCHACQTKRGGVVPPDGHRAITTTNGTCKMCLKIGASLVPSSDFDWPKENKKAIWD